MNSLNYRQATSSDVPGMARIRAAYWGTEEQWQQNIGRYMRCEGHPQQALMDRTVYVAAEDDDVVGFIAGHRTTRYQCDGELQWIDVRQEHRRRGIAAELLRHLARWFVDGKMLRVCVDVEPTNAAARSFYARFGAKPLNPSWLVWDDIHVVLDKYTP